MKTSHAPVPARGATRNGSRRWSDADLLPVMVLFWLVSLVRVVGAFVRHETFGVEATLASIALVGLPCAVLLQRHRKRA